MFFFKPPKSLTRSHVPLWDFVFFGCKRFSVNTVVVVSFFLLLLKLSLVMVNKSSTDTP